MVNNVIDGTYSNITKLSFTQKEIKKVRINAVNAEDMARKIKSIMSSLFRSRDSFSIFSKNVSMPKIDNTETNEPNAMLNDREPTMEFG